MPPEMSRNDAELLPIPGRQLFLRIWSFFLAQPAGRRYTVFRW